MLGSAWRQRDPRQRDRSRILIDCGYGARTLAGRLKMIGGSRIRSGLLRDAQHGDHVHGAKSAMKRWGGSCTRRRRRRCAAKEAGPRVNSSPPARRSTFPP
jgi:hypothetical protein